MRRILKWAGIGGGAVVGLAVLAALGSFLAGNARLSRTYDISVEDIEVPTDDAGIAHGRHLVETTCVGCHGDDLGGEIGWFDAGPLGTVDAANLTAGAGGIGRTFTTDDYVRAIRHGVGVDGRPLFMPAVMGFQYMSDADLGAIIAYLHTIPPVDRQTNGQRFTPVGKIVLATGQLGSLPVEAVDHEPHVTAPTAGATAEYGHYLVDITGCSDCHGAQLAGGTHPDPNVTLPVPNITPGGELAAWTEQDFIAAMRTGVTPGGRSLSPAMPWDEIGRFNDEELQAMWLYLQSLPAREAVAAR